MKKTAIAAVIGSLLSLPVHAVKIGNVDFSAAEICSKENATFLHPNSGCLPLSPVQNEQQYYYEHQRLPISIDDAKELDLLAKELSDNSTGSAIRANLLPSLIGRVFVTEKQASDSTDPDHIRYQIPENNGRLRFLNGTQDHPFPKLQTELMLSSNVTGIISKKLNASASVSLDPIIDTALKAVGIPASKVNTQLRANLAAALSKVSMGAGNYYYVSVSHKELTELTEGVLKPYLSPQPAGQSEARKSNEPAHPQLPPVSIPEEIVNKFGLTTTSLVTGQGLGIITGVAVLRTRSASSETCSHFAVEVDNKSKSPASSGNDATNCANLRNLLTEAGVAHADLPAAVANLNAGYSQDSDKTMQLSDHASVLAIQWIPLSLTKTVTTP